MKSISALCLFGISLIAAAEDSAPSDLPVEHVIPPDAQYSAPAAGKTTTADTPSTQPQNYEVVTRGIYQCQSRDGAVFVDENKQKQYRNCIQIRAPHYEDKSLTTDEKDNLMRQDTCSGALVYQGNTYIFSENEPCPIPESVFQARKPIESVPEYYEKPKND